MKAQTLAVGWHGLPAYAARLIARVPGRFPVIATKPKVPIQGMDTILPDRITWITEYYSGGWSGLDLPVPDLYFQPSWSTPSFNQLGAEVVDKGGKIVVMFDNPWRGDLRQAAGAFLFRTKWRKRFRFAWVAGKSGKRLARFWGFPENRIFMGMYGADPELFGRQADIKPLANRNKRFIFIGRLVEEKGVHELMSAWQQVRTAIPGWTLDIYGTGPLENVVKSSTAKFHGFQQPEIIAQALADSRFLILPSRNEHWGLVVCEAAQAGCGLVLSDRVGSHPDLLGKKNGRIFTSDNSSDLAEKLKWAASLADDSLKSAQQESLLLGAKFTPYSFARIFEQIQTSA